MCALVELLRQHRIAQAPTGALTFVFGFTFTRRFVPLQFDV
jgi:hypothetical protein